MKEATKMNCLLAIYDNDLHPTQYCINGIYDAELRQCLCEITDIEFDITHEVRLMNEWLFSKGGRIAEYLGEVGPGIILPTEVIQMININHFENFYA